MSRIFSIYRNFPFRIRNLRRISKRHIVSCLFRLRLIFCNIRNTVIKESAGSKFPKYLTKAAKLLDTFR